MEVSRNSKMVAIIMACVVVGIGVVMFILTFCKWAGNDYEGGHTYWTVGNDLSSNIGIIFVAKIIAFLILILGINCMFEMFVKNNKNKYYDYLFLFSVVSLLSDIILVVSYRNADMYLTLTSIPYIDVALSFICIICSIISYEYIDERKIFR